MELNSAKIPVHFKNSLFGQGYHDHYKPNTTLTHIYINTNGRSFISRCNNYSTLADTIQTKGAIYFATLQGYVNFETDM